MVEGHTPSESEVSKVKGDRIVWDWYPDANHEEVSRPDSQDVVKLVKYIIKTYVPRPHWTLKMEQPTGSLALCVTHN